MENKLKYPNIDFEYNAAGMLTKKTDNAISAEISYEYNKAGLKTQMTDPSGTYYDFVYDDAGRLTSVSENQSALALIDWNECNQRTKVTLKNGDTDFFAIFSKITRIFVNFIAFFTSN